jgi:hypothetical protein
MHPLIAAGLVCLVVAVVQTPPKPAAPAAAKTKPAAPCTAIGTPKPSLGFTYEHSESTGNKSQYTSYFEEVTTTGSRIRTTRGAGTVIQVNEHRVVDDVTVLDRTTNRTSQGDTINSTVFKPGLVGDPAFRACAARSWPIPSVTAMHDSTVSQVSSATPAGTLRIVAVREPLTVPAGKFTTVHYIRTSQSTDEYWKSIEHGVVVKHIATLPNSVVTDVLVLIK